MILKNTLGASLTYDTPVLNFDTPECQLLLLGEVSRRHAHDPLRADNPAYHNGYDLHRRLPVGLGLAMAHTLIDSGKMNIGDFWLKKRPYHIYTGKKDGQREGAIMKIYAEYKKTYMPSLSNEEEKTHLKNLMDIYFEKDPTVALSKGVKGITLNNSSAP